MNIEQNSFPKYIQGRRIQVSKSRKGVVHTSSVVEGKKVRDGIVETTNFGGGEYMQMMRGRQLNRTTNQHTSPTDKLHGDQHPAALERCPGD